MITFPPQQFWDPWPASLARTWPVRDLWLRWRLRSLDRLARRHPLAALAKIEQLQPSGDDYALWAIRLRTLIYTLAHHAVCGGVPELEHIADKLAALAQQARPSAGLLFWLGWAKKVAAEARSEEEARAATSGASGASAAPGAASLQEAAIGALRRAVLLDPTWTTPREALADVLQAVGREAESLAHLDAAVACRPKDQRLWNRRGIALVRLGMPVEAELAFRIAHALNPSDPVVEANRGLALARSGRYGEAARLLFDAVRHGLREPSVYHNLAFCLHQTGRPEAALVYYRKSGLAGPGRPELASLLETGPDGPAPEEVAATGAVPVAGVEAVDPPLVANIAASLVELGQFEQALALLDRAISGRPSDPHVWNARALALERSGRWREALDAFREGIRRHPREPLLLVNKASLLMARGRFGQALTLLKRAARLAPAEAEIRWRLALCAERLGRLDEALAEFNAVLERGLARPG